MFATRADLLKRSNASRLAQLAIPADRAMVDDSALRMAIEGGDLSAYSDDDLESITLAMDAIDSAIADAGEVIISYGIPADIHTTLLARIASTIAMYYLQGVERMTDDVKNAYDAAMKMLDGHAKGTLALVPVSPAEPVGFGAEITSNPTRYSWPVEDDY